ncbi:MAG: hypothetical protein ACE5Q6_21120, partial [Dehalococcoidia bacterium]
RMVGWRPAILVIAIVAVSAATAFLFLHDGRPPQDKASWPLPWTEEQCRQDEEDRAKAKARHVARHAEWERKHGTRITSGPLHRPRGKFEVNGPIVATASATGENGAVSHLTFQIRNAYFCRTFDHRDLGPPETFIKYTDNNRVLNLYDSREFTATPIGAHDGDSLMEFGEVIEFVLPILGEPRDSLGTDQPFAVEILPPQNQPVIYIQRTTPSSLEPQNVLD